VNPLPQIALGCGYYFALVLIVRLAGKRLAGQTTTFDLLVLIAMGVVLQGQAVLPGRWNALIFLTTVFATHRACAGACARWPAVRHLLRGAPRVLVRDGKVLAAALRDEGLDEADLAAGLRKLGFASPGEVRIACLEETGQIAAVPRQPDPPLTP
jgi:uncharacterized membrane protein YcaP (DUF421 family)